jgi:hypothetical protein
VAALSSIPPLSTSTPAVAAPAALRRSLSAWERRLVRAIAEAMFSEDGEVEAARLDAHVDDVDAHVTAVSKPLRVGLRLLLFVVRIAPMLMFFRATTLERLPVADRVAVLSRLERSKATSLSLAFVGWRTVMTLVFYEHPAELRALGYTSNERSRYKRGLPVFTQASPTPSLPAPAPAAPAPAAPAPAAPAPAPAPEESGVRLRGADDDEDEADGQSEVA